MHTLPAAILLVGVTAGPVGVLPPPQARFGSVLPSHGSSVGASPPKDLQRRATGSTSSAAAPCTQLGATHAAADGPHGRSAGAPPHRRVLGAPSPGGPRRPTVVREVLTTPLCPTGDTRKLAHAQPDARAVMVWQSSPLSTLLPRWREGRSGLVGKSSVPPTMGGGATLAIQLRSCPWPTARGPAALCFCGKRGTRCGAGGVACPFFVLPL